MNGHFPNVNLVCQLSVWDILKSCVYNRGALEVNYFVGSEILTNTTMKDECAEVLHIIYLLLIMLFANPKVERMISLMNKVKTD